MTATIPSIRIRLLSLDDVSEIAELLAQLGRKSITYEFSSSAEEKFLRSNDAASIRNFISNGFVYWVAEQNNSIVGFIGVRDHSHVYHLFVAEHLQRQGLGHRLWLIAKDACFAAGNPGRFTVNSSNGAVPFYKALGFRRTQPMQDSEGVLFNPMSVDVERRACDAEPSDSSTRDSVRAAYNVASEAYASKFVNELDHKPFDRELLQQFAEIVGTERSVLDIGCGPGHTTAHLTSLGLRATGVDLSPKMIEIASRTFSQSRFEVGDFCSLRHEPSSIAGVLAFYCIVHLTPEQLVPAFVEMSRVLSSDGVLLLSFHVGWDVIRAEKFLDTDAVLDFTFFQPQQIKAALSSAGFDRIDVRVRDPYETEHPSQRCYIFAHKI